MRLRKNRVSKASFLAGAIACVLCMQLILPAGAALLGKTIEVYTGVSVFVNNELVQMKDANGNPVEAFVYNGTTYLPARAIATSFNLPITYEAASQSVYVGKQPGEQPDVWLIGMDYFDQQKFDGGPYFNYEELDKDNLGETHQFPVNGRFSRTYKLNGQYSSLAGLFFQRYDKRSSNYISTFKVYADGRLIYENTMTAGKEPVNFNISLVGVLEVEIQFGSANQDYGSASHYSYNNAALGNCGFYLA